MASDVHSTLRRYIVENFLLGDDAPLTSSQSLLQTGVVDSTGILELVMFVEKTYAIQVADEEMLPENLDTLDNLAAFVERKLAAGGWVPGSGTPGLPIRAAALSSEAPVPPEHVKSPS